MISIDDLRQRFLRDSLPIQWGGIASDLVRLSSMAHAEKVSSGTFRDVLTETKLFTEWLAPEVKPRDQETLLSLQRVLSSWSVDSHLKPARVEKEAGEWSGRILKISELL